MLDPSSPSPAPRLGFSPSLFLGRHLNVRPGERVLCINDGSGLVALHAARAGAQVSLLEPNEDAQRSIRRSFLMGGFGEPDLQTASGPGVFPEGSFDLIAWTAPFLEGPAQNERDRRVFRGPLESLRPVLEGLPPLLDRGGRLLLPQPDLGDGDTLPGLLEQIGLRSSIQRSEHHRLWGPVRLYRAWVPRSGEAAGLVVGGGALGGAAWVLQDR